MSSPFAPPPPPGEGISWPDLQGRLLLIEVTAHRAEIKTAFGITDAVEADVAVLDGPDAGTEHRAALVFPKVLKGQLQRAGIGAKVLGRLGQGTAKPGQDPPWLLEPGSAEDEALGMRWINRPQAQTAPSAPPAPQGVPF